MSKTSVFTVHADATAAEVGEFQILKQRYGWQTTVSDCCATSFNILISVT